MAYNVLGSELQVCSVKPLTGYFRDGSCNTNGSDMGMHCVCVEMTDEFLEFARSQGNDLITPMPAYEFPGLKAGDRWCVCTGTVNDAIKAGIQTKIVLESTHISVKEFIDLEDLKACAVK